MAWITLALRKQSIQRDISEKNCYILELSRSIRATHRHLSYDQSIYNHDKTAELRDAKEAYNQAKQNRPDVSDSEAYEKWKVDYTQAQEEYQAKKCDIEDYYDGINQDLEEEAQMEEDHFNELKTQAETQRDALNAELSALQDEVKTEIQNEAIKF